MKPELFSSLQKKAQSFRGELAAVRRQRLQRLDDWIEKNQKRIIMALQADFQKPAFETMISEVGPTRDEIHQAMKNLKKWMRDKRVPTPLTLFGHKSFVRYENKGVVLIISPWNYPFQLALAPLVAALAAGNTAVIKPSELTPATSSLIQKMIADCFPEDEVTVELGSKDKTEELLSYPFDHVFFTGSTQVGRLIAAACAEKLIPVTLELGGKSPALVDETCDLDEAADKIFWGKYLNRGQTCIAPDFVMVQASVADEFVKKLRFLSEQNQGSEKASIINDNHLKRLQKLGETTEDLNALTLKILEIDSMAHPSMREEIFGPVLPVLRFQHLKDLENRLRLRDKPLALYVFSKNRNNIDYVMNRYTSGGAAVNSVLLHFANTSLPFGGVGASGTGRYHGHYGFLEMSHQRGVIEQRFLSGLRKLLMPPYTQKKGGLVSFLSRL